VSSFIAYDVARLFLGPLSITPRGIDRIDLALARHFFSPDTPRTAYGVLPTPWGIRAFPASQVRRGLEKLDGYWAEEMTAEMDPIWAQLRERMTTRGSIAASRSVARDRRGLSLAERLARLCRSLCATGIGLGQPVGSFLPRGAAYVNVGQISLAVPMLFRWLRSRPDIAAVFMLHDVIPIERPDLVEAACAHRHVRMVKTTARHADALIVSTNEAATGATRELANYGRHDVPTLVRRLPLSQGFMRGSCAHPTLDKSDYFVVCGTIEPRKNQTLLVEVWQRLIERDGVSAPHLVMVGTPGWGAQKLFTLLDGKPLLGGRVHHVAGLSTPALAQLIAGARALLVPSLAEGFSLPLLEARALGVPVVASDIPVHRERADVGVRLLRTDDWAAWLAAVDATPRGHLTGGMHAVDPALGERSYYEDIVKFIENRLEAKLGQDRPTPSLHRAASAPYHRDHDDRSLSGALQRDGSRDAVECA
jgi:glycosyltransferase involved in cell wall biosynthesis